MGKLNLITSSNKIILVVPGAEGNTINLPIDFDGISIRENF